MTLSTQRNESGLDTLGGRIRASRERAGLGIGNAAKAIKISRTSLGQWEAGNVQNPDMTKLAAFSRLCDVNLDWLIERKGPEPDLSQSEQRAAARRNGLQSMPPMTGDGAASPLPQPVGLSVREVAAPLHFHAKGIDLAPRSVWTIPEEVLELSFHSTPGSTVIMRVSNRSGVEFGLERDDYILVDTTRNIIDEPGVYILGDATGQSARRALAVADETGLKVTLLADDLSRPHQEIDFTAAKVLGRVMGVFRPL